MGNSSPDGLKYVDSSHHFRSRNVPIEELRQTCPRAKMTYPCLMDRVAPFPVRGLIFRRKSRFLGGLPIAEMILLPPGNTLVER